eukprot:1708175-Amphidinium_carterae.1
MCFGGLRGAQPQAIAGRKSWKRQSTRRNRSASFNPHATTPISQALEGGVLPKLLLTSTSLEFNM